MKYGTIRCSTCLAGRMSNAWAGVRAGRVDEDEDEGLFIALLPVPVSMSVSLFVEDMKMEKERTYNA